MATHSRNTFLISLDRQNQKNLFHTMPTNLLAHAEDLEENRKPVPKLKNPERKKKQTLYALHPPRKDSLQADS